MVFDFGGVIAYPPGDSWGAYRVAEELGLSRGAFDAGFKKYRYLWDGDFIPGIEMYRRIFADSKLVASDADLKRLRDAMGFVDAELANRLCPISVQRKLDVALEELFANVCRYAYAGQDEPGKVRVDYVYNTNPSSLTVSITDWGVPFDPVAYLDPSRPKSLDDIDNVGMGLMMAHKSVEDMSYVRDGDANVTAFRKEW